MKRFLVVLVTLGFVLGCELSPPEPTSTHAPVYTRYTCQEIAEEAKTLTEDKSLQIEEIYRLRVVTERPFEGSEPSLRECEGTARWSDGMASGITVWLEEKVDGTGKYGMETHEAIRITPTRPPFFAPTDTRLTPTSTPEPTVPRDQTALSTRSGFPVSPEGASNPSSEGSSADFGLEEFPHFPAAAIVRISTPHGSGSGFIFLTREDTAYVITNAHVIAGHSSVSVRVQNSDEYDAVFLGMDNIVDIAVLLVCCSDSFEEISLMDGLKITNPAPWSDNANSAWVGDPLVVVGYPLGSYDLVATSGKIHTTIETASGMRVVHDAVAEPGSSGSPVLSPVGRLMGVHFAGSIYGEEYSFFVPFDEAEYYSSQWLPRTDPAAAVVPIHQADVTIRFTNKGTYLLAAAASKVYLPAEAFEVEMVPDASGYTWTMYNRGAMSESGVFYNLINSAPKWNHEDVRADSFEARLSDGVLLGCERSLLSDDWGSLFTCRYPLSSLPVIDKARVHIMPNSFSSTSEEGGLALIVNTTFDVGPDELRVILTDGEDWWIRLGYPLVGSLSLDKSLTYTVLRAPGGRDLLHEDIKVLAVEHSGGHLECERESFDGRHSYWMCQER